MGTRLTAIVLGGAMAAGTADATEKPVPVWPLTFCEPVTRRNRNIKSFGEGDLCRAPRWFMP